MSSRRFRIALIAGALVVAAATAAFVSSRPITVPVARDERDVPVRVFGLGTIEAQVVSRIGFEVAGTLVEVKADHGDRVVAGQVLALLNSTAQRARVAKAEAGVDAAEAQQRRVAASLDRATAQAQQKRNVADRRRELAARGNTSAEGAEQADTEAAIAAADLAIARADLAVAHATLADASATLLSEQTALAKHTLVAPYDGLVVNRLREPGSALAPGEPVFTLIDAGSLWALAYIDEARAGHVAEGQPAEIRLRSLPGEVFPGRVVRVGLESDRVTEERRVYVRCSQCPPRPVIGEQVQVEIETGRVPVARLVPEVAVEGFDGSSAKVWVVEDGVLRQRPARFVARTLDARLVLAPEHAGLAVVTRIPRPLREGMAARAE